MKTVLCIDYFFPPLIGGWWIGLGRIRHLPKLGWQPIIVSASDDVSYPKDYSLLKEIPSSIEVHRVGHRELPREWVYACQKLKIDFVFPDIYRRWYSPALQEARKILQREKIDLIYSVSSPYTCHLIAMQLKKEFNIPWVAEWGDPWSSNTFLDRAYDATLIKPLRYLQKQLIRNAERKIVETANTSIVDCTQHQGQLKQLYNLTDKKLKLIMDTGYDEDAFTNLKPACLYPSKMVITFLGNIYPDFLETLANFITIANRLRKDIEFIFIGQGASVIQGSNLALPNVTCIAHLPREKALSFALASDFLLIIMPEGAGWIPAKLFEYIRLGKPILGLLSSDGDPAKIIQEAQAGFLISHDKVEMRGQLEAIFNQWAAGELVNFSPIQDAVTKFERGNLTKQLVNIFKEVISRENE